jgi:hypothetical protein
MATPYGAEREKMPLVVMDVDELVKYHLKTLIFLSSIEQDILGERHDNNAGEEDQQRRLGILHGRIEWEMRSIAQRPRPPSDS